MMANVFGTVSYHLSIHRRAVESRNDHKKFASHFANTNSYLVLSYIRTIQNIIIKNINQVMW